jgi:hypothetical protein
MFRPVIPAEAGIQFFDKSMDSGSPLTRRPE